MSKLGRWDNPNEKPSRTQEIFGIKIKIELDHEENRLTKKSEKTWESKPIT